MERCTLCGGRLANGRCTECGLDNTKNDKKYHLNVHNEKVTMFHRGKCEDNLNQDNDKAAAGRKKTAAGKSQKKTAAEKSWQQAGRKTSGARENWSGGRDSGSAEADWSTKKQRAKKRKERSQTGTVRKKSGLGRVIRWLVILFIAVEILSGIMSVLLKEVPGYFEEKITSIFEEVGMEDEEEGIAAPGASSEPEPLQRLWDSTAADYFELTLTPGVYTVGYEIPAGEYQIYCDEGTAILYWWNQEDEYSTSLCLFSEEDREAYIEDYGACDYFERSGVLELRDGAVIYLESCDGELRLAGESSGTVKAHSLQELPGEIYLKDGMAAGEDFPAGTYDVTFAEPDLSAGEYNSAFLTIKNEKNGTMYFVAVDTDCPVFYRFPFDRGSEIELDLYGEDAEVRLVPSY
ncbi:MAG: hypothetical protein Q4C61_16905 [Lachnospiraceae bacterium]|nr:hypothetical protein [Lachnospiraceae bacterium]